MWVSRSKRLHVFSTKVHERLATRLVAVHGAWHLWIYCRAWRLTHPMRPLAHSGSRPQRIDRALAVLDGQALISVVVDADARTSFTFDLGCTLLTWPYDHQSEQWLLYEPDGRALTVRADGRYSHDSSVIPAGDSQWHPLAPSGAFTCAGDRFLNLPRPSATFRASRPRSSRVPDTQAATPARAGWSVLCHRLECAVTETLSVEHSVSHHFEVHLTRNHTGAVVSDVTPTIRITDKATGVSRDLPQVTGMYGVQTGPSDFIMVRTFGCRTAPTRRP
jgi:hypothetical protein